MRRKSVNGIKREREREKEREKEEVNEKKATQVGEDKEIEITE